MDNRSLFEIYNELWVDEKYLISLVVNKYKGVTHIYELEKYSNWSKNTFNGFIEKLKSEGLLIEENDTFIVPERILQKIQNFTKLLTLDDIINILHWCGVKELKNFCDSNNLSKSGNKDVLVNRIIHSNIEMKKILNELPNNKALKELCIISGINPEGSKDEIIKRIIHNLEEEKVEKILKEIERSKKEVIPNKLKLFLSYSTEDLDQFQILDMYNILSRNPNIEKIYFWEQDCTAKTSLLTYMEKGVSDCDAFIVINSKNSTKSRPIQMEIEIAIYLNKKIIPICNNIDDVRLSLRTFRCLNINNFDIQELCNEIIRLIIK